VALVIFPLRSVSPTLIDGDVFAGAQSGRTSSKKYSPKLGALNLERMRFGASTERIALAVIRSGA
jgi:hypothetical protein